MSMDGVSLTRRKDRNGPSASLNGFLGRIPAGEVYIVVGAVSGPHATVCEVGGRWVLSLVGCHRALEVSFRHLSDAVRVAEGLVETAVLTAALSYRADPLLLEASA